MNDLEMSWKYRTRSASKTKPNSQKNEPFLIKSRKTIKKQRIEEIIKKNITGTTGDVMTGDVTMENTAQNNTENQQTPNTSPNKTHNKTPTKHYQTKTHNSTGKHVIITDYDTNIYHKNIQQQTNNLHYEQEDFWSSPPVALSGFRRNCSSFDSPIPKISLPNSLSSNFNK